MQGKITLCEYARVTNTGSRFDALGAGITNIELKQFPAPVSFAILVETKFTLAETGREHPFEIKIIDIDGKAAGPTLGGSIRVPPNHERALYASFHVQFMMKSAVKLSYSLLVNGEEKDCVCLEIKQGKQAQISKTLQSENVK